MDKRIKVLIVDDCDTIGLGIISLKNIFENLNFIGMYKTKDEALEFLKTNETDVIIMDISLKGADGIELTREILNIYPKIKIVIYSVHDDLGSIDSAMRAGALGFFTKDSDTLEFMQSLENLDENNFAASDNLKELVIKNQREIARGKKKFLEDMDIQIIIKICEGKSQKEIGEELNLCDKTISNRKTAILKKLNLKNDIELVKYAIKNNLISLD